MTSELDPAPSTAFVWIWLPGSETPVVAGRLDAVGPILTFAYGQSYLRRADAIPLYLPELPLQSGRQQPPSGMDMPGCIADAGPDAWGKRVIMRRILGEDSSEEDPAALGPLAYLLASGSDRIGALDFQTSPSEYRPRHADRASLDELVRAAERLEQGAPFSPVLDQALLRGTSIGGARPKALLEDGERTLIAKFSSTDDTYPVVKAEFVAMELAKRAGIRAAPVELARALDKDVLLVERFDRVPGGRRRALVSALTILELGEMFGRYASYASLAHIVRERFTDARATLRELFSRITFNVLVGNTDDHARNHAAFWDGSDLTLTPAYDVCPQPRSGGEARQAMAIAPDGASWSQLRVCVDAASTYLLSASEAREIIDHHIAVIRREWDDVCDRAALTAADRRYFWRRQFLNPYALEGYATADV
jgi:serine/threonine-protein kinase HipA